MLIAVALVLVLAAIGWFRMRSPESTAALRGRKIARELGCSACHGEEGAGGVPTLGAVGKNMPGWHYGTAVLYIRNDADIHEWILHGAPLDWLQSEEPLEPDGIVPMPAYADLLNEEDLHDLVAYFKAVAWWTPDIPEDAEEGRAVASRLGCFGCHGPSGIGGMPNPGSFKGHIPPWDGDEFDDLVHDEDELREWILDGRIRRLWDQPFARRFLEAQKTQMPAYRDHISDRELDDLVAFIQWLRNEK